MTALAFVDTETTGLDPDRHEIWEVGLILQPDHTKPDDCEEFHWFLPIYKYSNADPVALDIGKFHTRYPHSPLTFTSTEEEWIDSRLALESFARDFTQLTWGATLIGAVPSFDEERLRKLVQSQGFPYKWHYHLLDIESVMLGYIMGKAKEWLIPESALPGIPFKHELLLELLGVTFDEESKHTALGDARNVKACWDLIYSANLTE